jgi:hypothetical protein
MEVNVRDHSNCLIDVEQDIDQLQSDSRTTQEFMGHVRALSAWKWVICRNTSVRLKSH